MYKVEGCMTLGGYWYGEDAYCFFEEDIEAPNARSAVFIYEQRNPKYRVVKVNGNKYNSNNI